VTPARSSANVSPPRSSDPGRRGTFVEQARRTQIVQCAAEEIAEHGYAAASVVAIARRAGVSRGVVAYHFSGRDDLVDAVVAAFYADAAAYIVPRVKGDNVHTLIASLIRANVAFLAEHPVQVRATAEIAINHRSATGERLEDTRPEPAAGRAGLMAIFRRGQSSGELRDFDRRAMAIAMRRSIDAVIDELVRDPDFDATAYAEQLVTIFDLATRARGRTTARTKNRPQGTV
jgi:TetR/AcrR family transcriptional regulator, fatty acid metabolism regulator protein